MLNNQMVVNAPKPAPQSGMFIHPLRDNGIGERRNIQLKSSSFRKDVMEVVNLSSGTYVVKNNHVCGVGWDYIEKRKNVVIGSVENSEWVIDSYGFPVSRRHDTIEGVMNEYTYFDKSKPTGDVSRNVINLVPMFRFDTDGEYDLLYNIKNINCLVFNAPLWSYDSFTEEGFYYGEIIDESTTHCIIYEQQKEADYQLVNLNKVEYEKRVVYEHDISRGTVTIVDSDRHTLKTEQSKSLKNIPIFMRQNLKRLF